MKKITAPKSNWQIQSILFNQNKTSKLAMSLAQLSPSLLWDFVK
jgi:hypothetical protein